MASNNEERIPISALEELKKVSSDDIVQVVSNGTNMRVSMNTLGNGLLDAVQDDVNDGRDAAVIFADEIAGYEDEWAWIQARINKGNYSGLRHGDYIPLTFEGNQYTMRMNIDTYYHFSDEDTGHCIDFISDEVIPDTVQWNLENNNNGNADSAYPYMVSNLKAFLDEKAEALPSNVKKHISSKRMLLEQRYSSSGTLTDSTSWGWQDMGLLWVPVEYEVGGSVVWGTPGYSQGMSVQYPIFQNGKNRIKYAAGDKSTRRAWWLACARSGYSTRACYCASSGLLNNYSASGGYRVPLCFRIVAE